MTDVEEGAAHLRALAAQCTDLKNTLRQFGPRNGADAVEQIRRHIAVLQDIAASTLKRIPVLLGSQIACLAGTNVCFNGLGFIIEGATAAAASLGHAITHIDLDIGLFHPGNAYPRSIRTRRRLLWRSEVTRLLQDVADRLDTVEEDCLIAAIYMESTLPDPADDPEYRTTRPVSQRGRRKRPLSAAQATALRLVGENVTVLYRGQDGKTLFGSCTSVPVSMATYHALAGRGLVARDTRTNLTAGQRVTLTPAGRRALATLRRTRP
ncbi:hypothetical protein [Streptomyces sp. NPDC056244]|uniref:hypothetical protein n=1 Tax=Streptomyces sp. NPDC056244 TaxID=3345762 RepID=UPI0035E08FE8